MKSIVIFMFFISSLTFSQSADVKSINDDQVKQEIGVRMEL